MRLELGVARLKHEVVAAFGELDEDGVVCALGGVILGELDAKTAGLNANGGIGVGIEVGAAAVNFGGNLILLEGSVGVKERLLGEVLKEAAERFRAAENMAFGNVIYLLEEFFRAKRESACDSHRTGK